MVHAALEAFRSVEDAVQVTDFIGRVNRVFIAFGGRPPAMGHSLEAAEVRIAEGPCHRRNTLELAEAAGYFKTIPSFESLLTGLNLDDISYVPLKKPLPPSGHPLS